MEEENTLRLSALPDKIIHEYGCYALDITDYVTLAYLLLKVMFGPIC